MDTNIQQILCYTGANIHILTKKQRIEAFTQLGDYMLSNNDTLTQIVESTHYSNPWFTPSNTRKALVSNGTNLTEGKLENWLAPYSFDNETDKTVALILAGNIPLVGFHDILSVLCAGYRVKIKPSADDPFLTKHLIDKLLEIEPNFASKVSFVERLQDFDLVIATGSDNSARYFNYYFGKKPHIIRKNRNSIAVISGEETGSDIRLLGADVFDYFGLGCRSVSKLFIPSGYDVSAFFEGIAPYEDVINHYKYANNYDYNKSIYLINGDRHYDNGFLLLKHDSRIASPLAVLYFEEYRNTTDLEMHLAALTPQLQCVVSNKKLSTAAPVVGFGQSQQPCLTDYADGINTLEFLDQHR